MIKSVDIRILDILEHCRQVLADRPPRSYVESSKTLAQHILNLIELMEYDSKHTTERGSKKDSPLQ